MVGGGLVYISVDAGATWTAQESARNWKAVASSSDGRRIVAVVVNGPIFTSTSDSTAGSAGDLLGEPNAAVELQYIGNGQFIPLSYIGTIIAY